MMDYKGCKCASCHKVLKEGDDIVICPECGAPYHRECYAAEGRCVFSAKHGKGFEYVPPEAKPDVNANGPICPVCHAQNPPDTLFCERCGPVSYTHLDVYKRQRQYRAAKGLRRGVCQRAERV